MKLKCSQKSLLPRLQDAAHVASQNSPESPLRRVALSAAAGRINLHAVSARATVRHLWASTPADVTSPGTACVEAQLIAELTASYPKDAEMELSLQGNSRRLKVTCGNSIANLLTGPKPPQEPDLANPQTALLDPQQLHRCLAAALPAASLLPDNPTINGVRLQLDHHGLTLAATDGFRMAVARHGEGGGDPNPIYLILPYQAARDLSKAAARATGPVRLEKDTTNSIAQFSIALPENGAARITTYLTVGHFPDPYALMPQKHATRALVCPEAAAASARISASFAGKKRDAAPLPAPPSQRHRRAKAGCHLRRTQLRRRPYGPHPPPGRPHRPPGPHGTKREIPGRRLPPTAQRWQRGHRAERSRGPDGHQKRRPRQPDTAIHGHAHQSPLGSGHAASGGNTSHPSTRPTPAGPSTNPSNAEERLNLDAQICSKSPPEAARKRTFCAKITHTPLTAKR